MPVLKRPAATSPRLRTQRRPTRLANQISPYSPFFKPLAYQAFLERAVIKPIGCFWHEAAVRWLLELKFHATYAETKLKTFLVCHQMDRHAFGVLHN
jgi:hypothetical protein